MMQQMQAPVLYDLFCCEGGAGEGYRRAGFTVIGVDLEPQPLYPFPMIQEDALAFLDRLIANGTLAAAVHASPPCQSYSNMSNRHGSKELELIAPVRERLTQLGLPWIIENVVGARRHMRNPITLHGGQFPELGVYRPRLFESNIPLCAPPKAPRPKNAAAVYGVRDDGRRLLTRKDGTELRAARLPEARIAMGMPWADWNGVREAIPPAYAEYVGRQLFAHCATRRVAA